jgi:hypothetical protein
MKTDYPKMGAQIEPQTFYEKNDKTPMKPKQMKITKKW